MPPDGTTVQREALGTGPRLFAPQQLRLPGAYGISAWWPPRARQARQKHAFQVLSSLNHPAHSAQHPGPGPGLGAVLHICTQATEPAFTKLPLSFPSILPSELL